jgi:dTDP-4-amino-4,6-dideoxygalactose transaminase
LAKICDVSAACAVQSGTAALYGAVKALGVDKPEHHVICPTFTCAACADAVVHAGGSPVVVDCELDSYGLSYDAVVNALNSDPNIVGIVIAPCYGVPARDHNKIYSLAMEKGLWLCEDNCETYGAGMDITELQKDKTPTVGQVGSMSTISVVSVRSEKMVGVGEGGAILSKDLDLVSKARWWCSRAPVKGGGMWRVYDHEAIGQNFRLPECLGAVGLAACENLPVMIENKRKIHGWYEQYMSPEATPREELHPYLRAIKFQKGKGLDEPVWWINSIILPVNAEKVGMLLMQKFPHIEVRPAFYPLHSMNIFKEHSHPGPNADHLYESLLCLPSSAMLVEDDVKEICSAVRECLHEVVITEKTGA